MKKNILNIRSLKHKNNKSIFELQSYSRDNCYKYFLDYFYSLNKHYLRKHRNYFKIDNRGFGEDAFHAMWDFLIKEFKPINILEIGVYRGQTLSLFSLLTKRLGYNSNVFGICPLNDSSDKVSEYLDIDYLEDIKTNFKYFNLEKPNIVPFLSTDDESINFISSKNWDLVYIDGSHDFEIVLNDTNVCLKNLNKNGLLILDDSSLYTDFNLELGKIKTFKGHPGPSKVFEILIKEKKLKFLFGVGHNNIFLKE